MEASHFNRLLKSISKDEKSFNELYEYYGRRIVFRLTRVYGKEIAEETLHDFFLKLIKHEGKYEYIQKPTSWVYTCCENIAKTKITTESRQSVLWEEYYIPEVYENIENVGLKEALSQLDDITYRIIYLYYWSGYNLEEISEIMGLNYATVRQRHKRAKTKFEKILE